MILADTSVWIDYFRGVRDTGGFEDLLISRQIIVHPWVAAELLLGNLGKAQKRILDDIFLFVQLPVSDLDEVTAFIRNYSLPGKGIGLIDAELLYATLTAQHLLWTNDLKLRRLADHFGVGYNS